MPKITFIDHAGESRTGDASPGETLMEAGVKNDVPGLEAECGGACACATCHVYILDAYMPEVGPPAPAERDMLEFANAPVQANSRLSCQICVTEEMDGMQVTTPEVQ